MHTIHYLYEHFKTITNLETWLFPVIIVTNKSNMQSEKLFFKFKTIFFLEYMLTNSNK